MRLQRERGEKWRRCHTQEKEVALCSGGAERSLPRSRTELGASAVPDVSIPAFVGGKAGIILWHIETDLFLNGQQIANARSPLQQCNHVHLCTRSRGREAPPLLRLNWGRHFYLPETLVWKEKLTEPKKKTPRARTQSSSCARHRLFRKKK